MNALGLGFARVANSGFRPTSLSGLVMWLDGTATATMFTDEAGTTPINPTQSGPVMAWADRANPSKLYTNSSTTVSPVWAPTTTGATSGMVFDGVDDGLYGTTTGFPTGNCTVISVARHDGVIADYAGIVNWGLANTGQYIFQGFGNTWSGQGYGVSQYGDQVSVAAQTNATKAFGLIRTGATYQLYLNNVASSSKNMTTGTVLGSSQVTLGVSNISPMFFLHGVIYCVLVWNRVLTAAEMIKVQNYLNTKYLL